MGRRSRKQWLDSAFTATIAGTATGTITEVTLISEATIEDALEGDATVVRVLGDINIFATAGDPIVQMMLYGGVPYGFGANGVLAVDNYEDPRVMWLRQWADRNDGSTAQFAYVPVDVRAKRRLRRNQGLFLVLNDISATVGADYFLTGHLRALVVTS